MKVDENLFFPMGKESQRIEESSGKIKKEQEEEEQRIECGVFFFYGR